MPKILTGHETNLFSALDLFSKLTGCEFSIAQELLVLAKGEDNSGIREHGQKIQTTPWHSMTQMQVIAGFLTWCSCCTARAYSSFLPPAQEVRSICKTRNQLTLYALFLPLKCPWERMVHIPGGLTPVQHAVSCLGACGRGVGTVNVQGSSTCRSLRAAGARANTPVWPKSRVAVMKGNSR